MASAKSITQGQLKRFDKVTEFMAQELAHGRKTSVPKACKKTGISPSYFSQIKRLIVSKDTDRAEIWVRVTENAPATKASKAIAVKKPKTAPRQGAVIVMPEPSPERDRRVVALIGEPRDIAEALRGF